MSKIKLNNSEKDKKFFHDLKNFHNSVTSGAELLQDLISDNSRNYDHRVEKIVTILIERSENFGKLLEKVSFDEKQN